MSEIYVATNQFMFGCSSEIGFDTEINSVIHGFSNAYKGETLQKYSLNIKEYMVRQHLNYTEINSAMHGQATSI